MKKENVNLEIMSELIKQFKDEATEFVLVAPYNSGYDINNHFGKYKLSQELANQVISDIELFLKNSDKRIYNKIDKQKYNLPTLKELVSYRDSENNVDLTQIKDLSELVKNNLADKFMRGQLKYKEPTELWSFFHNQDFVNNVKLSAMKMVNLKEERPLDIELDSQKNKQLKNSLIKIEVTHIWHCTISGQLSKVFYFKLNDETINWLLQYENIYQLRNLDDLAFYKNDKLLFSSCTHEGFYNVYE